MRILVCSTIEIGRLTNELIGITESHSRHGPERGTQMHGLETTPPPVMFCRVIQSTNPEVRGESCGTSHCLIIPMIIVIRYYTEHLDSNFVFQSLCIEYLNSYLPTFLLNIPHKFKKSVNIM